MNMTEKNGQPSMEEILASIRRIIAEEPVHQHNGELGGTPILLKGDGILDDAGDFDLPAIFRSSPPQTDRPSPLLGRLTDAIRSATAAQPEEPRAVNGHGMNGHADVHGEPVHDPHAGLSTLTLRATEITQADESGYVNGHMNGHMNGSAHHEVPHAALVAPGASQPSVVQAAAPEEPKRVMAAFKDTHFMRLSGGAPQPQPAAPVTPVAPAMPVAAPMPMPAPVEVAPPEAVVAPSFAAAPAPEMVAPVIVQPAVAVPPPPLPASVLPIAPAAPAATGEPAPVIEDATADLLRPMLRQWLAENMPRMVEKALHIEIAESVKPTKKL